VHISQNYGLPSLDDFGIAALKVLIFAAFIVLGWALINKITRFDDHRALFVERNVGYALERVGLVFGQAIAFTSLIDNRSDDTRSDFAWLGGGGVWILAVLLVVRTIARWLIVAGEPADAGTAGTAGPAGKAAHGARGGRTVDRTLSVGLVRGSFYVASGMVLDAGLSGGAPNLMTKFVSTEVFTTLGIVILVVAYLGNGRIRPYRLNERVREGNMAAAMISSGFMIALGLVLRKAIYGDFTGWTNSLVNAAVTAVGALIVFYLLCFAVDRWAITNATLAEVIAGGQELAAAVVAVALIAIAIGVSLVAT
jgi:uncharacterized membrane protein YjfL (UPF0719 family)